MRPSDSRSSQAPSGRQVPGTTLTTGWTSCRRAADCTAPSSRPTRNEIKRACRERKTAQVESSRMKKEQNAAPGRVAPQVVEMQRCIHIDVGVMDACSSSKYLCARFIEMICTARRDQKHNAPRTHAQCAEVTSKMRRERPAACSRSLHRAQTPPASFQTRRSASWPP